MLKPFEPQDGVSLYNWYFSGDYKEYFRDISCVPGLEQFRLFATMANAQVFSVWHNEGGLIGNALVYDIRPNSLVAKFGMMLTKPYQKKSLGLELAWVLGDYLFNGLRIRKLVFEPIDPRLGDFAKRAGCKKEATLKREAYVDGKYFDVYRYYIERPQGLKALERMKEVICHSSQQHRWQPERVPQEQQPVQGLQ